MADQNVSAYDLYAMGQSAIERGDFAGAVEPLTRALSLEPQPTRPNQESRRSDERRSGSRRLQVRRDGEGPAMAELSDKSGEVTLNIKPVRTKEVGEPTWITFQCQVTGGASSFLKEFVDLTIEDADALCGLLEGVELGHGGSRFESTDADFLLSIESIDSEGDLAVAVWSGEPYRVMRGVRFVAVPQRIGQCGTHLRSDLREFLVSGIDA